MVGASAAAGSSSAATVPLFVTPGPEGLAPPPWRVLGLGRVARWAGVMVPLGLLLFLVAPRQDNFQWEPKQLTRAMKGTMRTGFDSGMDLNRVGKIEMSDEPAFEVEARDAHGPKLDLNPETHHGSSKPWTITSRGAGLVGDKVPHRRI